MQTNTAVEQNNGWICLHSVLD